MKSKQFEIGIDHAMLQSAKAAFDTCLKRAMAKAIATGSDEGSATLRIAFEIMTVMDEDSGETKRMPLMKYKAGYSVPMKESVDATIAESSRLIQGTDGLLLVNGQISMDELMEAETPEEDWRGLHLAEVR